MRCPALLKVLEEFERRPEPKNAISGQALYGCFNPLFFTCHTRLLHQQLLKQRQFLRKLQNLNNGRASIKGNK